MSQPFDPNKSPYVPQVHNTQRKNEYLGPPQDQQRGMRGKLIESILQLVMQAITGVFLPGPLGSAFTQLQNFFANILPEQIKGPINALITILIQAFDLIPIIGPPVGDAIEYLAQIFGLMRDETGAAQETGENAQTSADNANVAIAALEGRDQSSSVPGGKMFNDTFNRTGADLGPNYTRAHAGAAGGQFATEGNNAYYQPTGSGFGVEYAFITPAALTFATNYQAIQTIQDTALGNIFDPCEIHLILRCNAAHTDYVIAVIRWQSAEIYKVVAGVSTSLGGIAHAGTGPGDRWTFKAGAMNGATAVDRRFVLIKNADAPLLTVDDTSGTLSGMSAAHVHAGFAERSGQTYIPPFFTGIVWPPALQSVTAYDRLIAA